MNKEKLIGILKQTIETETKQRKLAAWIDPESYLARMILREVTINDEMQKLLETHLRSEPQFQIFDGKMMNSGSGATRVEINTLARWLIMRSIEIKPEGAIEELERYLSLPTTPGYEILAIAGIELEEPLELSNKLTLVPFSDLPDSLIKETLDPPMLKPLRAASLGIPPQYFMAHEATVPKAALIRKTEFSPKTYETYELGLEISTLGLKQKELFEACACLTLVGPSTPLPIAYWTEIEEWIPCAVFLGQGWSSPTHDVIHVKNYLIKNADCSKAQEIHKIFSQSALISYTSWHIAVIPASVPLYYSF